MIIQIQSPPLKSSEFEELDKKKLPLPRPLLALLQSLIKLETSESLSSSDCLSHPLYNKLFTLYFPKKNSLNPIKIRYKLIHYELILQQHHSPITVLITRVFYFLAL